MLEIALRLSLDEAYVKSNDLFYIVRSSIATLLRSISEESKQEAVHLR